MYALQSKSIEANMEVIRWLVRPTLVKKSNYMYYAYLIKQDGQTMPQIVATVFDRKGYIPFRLVPRNLTSSSSDEEFQETIEAALALYSPNTTEAYSDYTKGDKVSEYGVFGVLAALAGIKWGKAVAVGAFATFMLFAKKFWWIIFIPIAFFGRKLFKKKD